MIDKPITIPNLELLRLVLAGLALAGGMVFLALDRVELAALQPLQVHAEKLIPAVRKQYPQLSPSAVLALASMRAVHQHLTEQALGTEPEPLVPRSSASHMEDPRGACASYSQVLAKVLSETGYRVRKVGLRANGVPAAHHFLEALVDDHWVMLDPSFDLSILQADARSLASTAELQQNWVSLSSQIPPGVQQRYDFRHFYYTNWERVPLLRSLPFVVSTLEAREVSLRFWFLNKWRVATVLSLGFGAFCILLPTLWSAIARGLSKPRLAARSALSGQPSEPVPNASPELV